MCLLLQIKNRVKEVTTMKKLLSVILILSILLSSSSQIFAKNGGYEKAEPFFSESEAADIALLFVLKNMDNSGTWNKNTMINKVYTLYDVDDAITGYTFCLNTDGNESGYICVSANEDEMPIQEFSFSGTPIFEESLEEGILSDVEVNDFSGSNNKNNRKGRIVYNGPLEYFLNSDGKYYDMDRKKIPDKKDIKKHKMSQNGSSNSKRNHEIKKLIQDSYKSYMGATYDGQISGYVIDDRFDYMIDRYEDYRYEDGNSLSGFPGLDMDDFGDDNDCTLVSITAMSYYCHNNGYDDIPSSTTKIYNDVLDVAEDHGYTPEGGTNPTVIDNIIEDVFDEWGYDINASNVYIWSFSTFTNEIDRNRPVIFNIATGYYSNHSVSIFGYKEYDVADFLMVKDNWSTSTRYIHYQEMYDDFGSVTKTNIDID
jgi:hypothetical protein